MAGEGQEQGEIFLAGGVIGIGQDAVDGIVGGGLALDIGTEQGQELLGGGGVGLEAEAGGLGEEPAEIGVGVGGHLLVEHGQDHGIDGAAESGVLLDQGGLGGLEGLGALILEDAAGGGDELGAERVAGESVGGGTGGLGIGAGEDLLEAVGGPEGLVAIGQGAVAGVALVIGEGVEGAIDGAAGGGIEIVAEAGGAERIALEFGDCLAVGEDAIGLDPGAGLGEAIDYRWACLDLALARDRQLGGVTAD